MINTELRIEHIEQKHVPLINLIGETKFTKNDKWVAEQTNSPIPVHWSIAKGLWDSHYIPGHHHLSSSSSFTSTLWEKANIFIVVIDGREGAHHSNGMSLRKRLQHHSQSEGETKRERDRG